MYFIMIDDQSEVKRFFNMIFAEWYSWTERKKGWQIQFKRINRLAVHP